MYAYIDESGDTGNSKKSSRHFILTCIVIDDERKVKNKLKKLLQKVLKSERKHPHYFHAYKESDSVRKKLSAIVSECTISVHSVVVNKKFENLYINTLDNLLDTISKSHKLEKVVIASYDKRKSTIRKYELDKRFEVRFTTPQDETPLQLADIVSWCIYQSLENDNNVWFRKLKEETKIQIQQNP